jgi:hypothetical protein
MYKVICDYVKNTHAKSHSLYTVDVEDIFAVEREGEEENFKEFKDNENRRLLWHGSRTTNYMGILSQGLRIVLL